MKTLNYLAILTIGYALAGNVDASTVHVPFYNLPMQPAEDLYVSYTFDDNKSVIICSVTSGDMMADMKWQYRGVTYKAQLPLRLKANGAFEAQLADQRGTFIISTNSGYSDGITVTCE